MKKRFFSTMCAILGVTLLSGCGGNNNQKTDAMNESEQEYVYKTTYESINDYADYVNQFSVLGDSIHFANTLWNEEDETSVTQICKFDLKTKTGSRLDLHLDSGENVNFHLDNIYPLEDGTYKGLLMEYTNNDNGDYKSTCYLADIDAEGNLVEKKDITAGLMGENDWPDYQFASLDSKGNLFFFTSEPTAIKAIDAEGKTIFEKKVDNWLNSMLLLDDNTLAYSFYGNNGGMECRTINLADGTVSEPWQNVPGINGNMRVLCKLGDESVMISVSSDVYAYNYKSGTSEKIFNWIDLDINGDNINTLIPLDEEHFVTIVSEYNSSTEKTDNSLVTISKEKRTEAPTQTVLTLALPWEDYQVKNAVIKFNRSNDKYRISLKTYESSEESSSTQLLDADIAAGNIPDIIDFGYMNYLPYASKGLLADMSKILEEDGTINRSDFVESALKMYEYNGVLYALPTTFTISTLMGKAETLNGMKSWNMQQYMDFIKELPEGVSIMSYADKNSALYMMAQSNMSDYVDMSTGQCHFNEQPFIDVLEFANTFPKEFQYNEEVSLPLQLQSGEVVLLTANIYSVQEYQMNCLMFETDSIAIGYPTEEGNGARISSGSSSFAITEKCEHKDGALAFLKAYMEETKSHGWGLPVNKKDLEEVFAESMEKEYYTNENGEEVESPKTTWGYDNWEADIYAATQEDIEAIRELIDGALPMAYGNEDILNIISEEAGAYFEGQKTAKEVADIIQSRVTIYVSENQ